MKLWAIIPELIIAALCLFLVPVAGWVRGRWRVAPGLAAVAGLAVALFFTARMLPWDSVSTFQGAYAVDGFSTVFKLLIESGALITLILLLSYLHGHTNIAHAPVAVLFATLGAVCLCSSVDLGLIVLFLEMMAFASYLLPALVRTDGRALEATLKYFIFGAVTLAAMAYGLTFLYGLTGSLDLREIGTALPGADRAWIAFALTFVLIGFGFEITMVPFHFWAPDVFSGATAPVAGFISVVPKIAAFAALLRFLVQGLPGELAGWPWVIAFLSVLTMTFGNLVALRQKSLKRLLAYSSIAQGGYLLIPVAVGDRGPEGWVALAYYLAAYLFMNLGAFAVVAQLERTFGTDRREAIRGLGRRSPMAAALLTLALFSLAGIPPLAGFAGKVLLLEAALDGGMAWLAVVAAANMVVALYYYVSIVAEMVMHAPEHGHRLRGGAGYVVSHAVTVAGTLILGILPGPHLQVVSAVQRMLK